MRESQVNSCPITMQFLTVSPLSGRDEVAALLGILCDGFPEFAPEFYNFYEPINRPFMVDTRAALLDEWESPFLWRRSDIKLNGAINQRPQRSKRHASIEIDILRPPPDEDRICELFYALARQLHSDIAFLHPLVPGEHARSVMKSDDGFTLRGRIIPPRLSTDKLRVGLPDLFWLTALGSPYVNLFGRELIGDAPAAAVEFVDEDLFAMKLTPKWRQFAEDYNSADRVRKSCMKHLGLAAFQPVAPGRSALAPDFLPLENRFRTTRITRINKLRKTPTRRPPGG